MNCNYFSKSYFQQVAVPHPTYHSSVCCVHCTIALLELLTKPESAQYLHVGTMMPSVICKHSNACWIFTQQLSRMKLKCFVIIIEILNKPLTHCFSSAHLSHYANALCYISHLLCHLNCCIILLQFYWRNIKWTKSLGNILSFSSYFFSLWGSFLSHFSRNKLFAIHIFCSSIHFSLELKCFNPLSWSLAVATSISMLNAVACQWLSTLCYSGMGFYLYIQATNMDLYIL